MLMSLHNSKSSIGPCGNLAATCNKYAELITCELSQASQGPEQMTLEGDWRFVEP